MARGRRKLGAEARTVIKRVERASDGAAHGGAWKVAYADFVTAMMAFFLVMWLLNATTEDQRKGLADYFSPNNVMSHASSGTGQPFGGHTVLDDGALVSDRGSVEVLPGTRPPGDPSDDPEPAATPVADPPAAIPTPPPVHTAAPAPAPAAPPQAAGATPPAQPAAAMAHADDAAKPDRAPSDDAEQRLQAAAEQLRRSIAADPQLAALAGQVLVDVTGKGLRVQLVDATRQAMFATGSAEPNEAARLLLRKIVPVLQSLPGALEIEGHTDAAPYPGPQMTNWDLSAERANAARRMLMEAGVPEARIQQVTGHADHDLLIKDQPLAPANRRIAIIVLRPQASGAAN
ncbi:MAG TPA: flagellar motor protein MotB [Acetobacteraceae bacterium]|nr:flagellar motor protein MotB [Acetobacteraceae bacterium]